MFGPSKKELESRIVALALYCAGLNTRLLEIEKKGMKVVPQMKPFIRSSS